MKCNSTLLWIAFTLLDFCNVFSMLIGCYKCAYRKKHVLLMGKGSLHLNNVYKSGMLVVLWWLLTKPLSTAMSSLTMYIIFTRLNETKHEFHPAMHTTVIWVKHWPLHWKFVKHSFCCSLCHIRSFVTLNFVGMKKGERVQTWCNLPKMKCNEKCGWLALCTGLWYW